MAVSEDTMRASVGVHPRHQDEAVAWWLVAPGRGELRDEPLPARGSGDATVRTLWTGISRGTETLVARGAVPASERERMRAPHQAGEFPFPVKYGYLLVGVVEAGPPALRDRTVFGLFPHQSRIVAPVETLVPVPDGVPARRAVLAGAAETAVNVLWDASPLIGDRITVIGAGMIGCAIGLAARGIPGVAVTVVDADEAKAPVADALGVGFATASDAVPAADVVIEASGDVAGLQLALRLAATDGEVIVASWYAGAATLELGGDFHSRRLSVRTSQVGAVATSRRARRTTRDRLELALRLLADPDWDVLLGGASAWRELPEVAAALRDATAGGLCHTIDWSAA